MIRLRCAGCKREMQVERAAYDPPQAEVLVTSACDQCDKGDFEMVHYLGADGAEVVQARPL